MKLMDEAIAAEPRSGEAYYVRGLVRMKMKGTRNIAPEEAKARADFSKAVELDPKLAEAWKALALSHHEASAGVISWVNAENLAKALVNYNHYLELKKDDPAAFEARGAILQSLLTMKQEGDLDEDVKFDAAKAPAQMKSDFLAAVKLDANRKSAHYGLAKVYRQEGNYVECKKALIQVLRIDPKFTEGRIMLADAARDAGDWGTELEAAERLLREKETPEWMERVGRIFLRWRVFERAIAEFTKAIELNETERRVLMADEVKFAFSDSDDVLGDIAARQRARAGKPTLDDLKTANVRLLCLRGQARGLGGKLEEALKDFDAAIKEAKNPAIVYLMRGDMYQELGKSDKAAPDWTLAAQKIGRDDPGMYKARLEMMQAAQAASKGDPKAATTMIEEAIRHDRTFAASYELATILYARSKEFDKALKHADEWLKLAPRSADAWMTRGKVYVSVGNYDEALADLNQATSFTPFNAALHYLIADLDVRQKHFVDACNALESGLANESAPAPMRQLQYAVLQTVMAQPAENAGTALKQGLEKASAAEIQRALDLAAVVTAEGLSSDRLKGVTAQLQARLGALQKPE
jgi:tetratricopeptide (TPR) repeat protein